MVAMVRRLIVVLLRLVLLGVLIYLITRDHLMLGLAALIVTYPLWEVLFSELRPLGPNNWAKAKPGVCYNHSRHHFSLNFRAGATARNLKDVYVRLKNFSDFNGKTNSVARMRSEMVGNAKYIYFDSLGLFGLLSVLINPPSIPDRVWSRRKDRLVVADTADGHMLKGQRRWRAKRGRNNRIVVSTEAYEHPRNLANRIGMRLMGADRQAEIWTSYFENMRLHYAVRAISTLVSVAPVDRVALPSPSPPKSPWVPLPNYPGVEV